MVHAPCEPYDNVAFNLSPVGEEFLHPSQGMQSPQHERWKLSMGAVSKVRSTPAVNRALSRWTTTRILIPPSSQCASCNSSTNDRNSRCIVVPINLHLFRALASPSRGSYASSRGDETLVSGSATRARYDILPGAVMSILCIKEYPTMRSICTNII